jgi:Ni,Fe-hydrogenase III small subunit
VLAAGGVGLFAALPALPPAYVDFVRLEGVNAGEVPEFDLQSVYVQLVSEPAGADVVDAAGQVLGQTPHVLRRPRNAPEVRLTFRKAGHLAYGRAIAFAEDAKVSVVLDPIVPEPARVDPAQANPSRTEATAAPAATTPTSGSPTAASEPPPARTPPSGPRKVDETKANPYGAGRPAPEPAKANPYQ